MRNKIKVIILAAGIGSRMGCLTKDRPKCLLEFQGKTLLETQIKIYHSFNINNIVVVKGYLKEMINFEYLKYYINNETSNMVHSLFCAEKEMEGNLIIAYADIIFEKSVLSSLLSADYDISVIIDMKWENYFKARFEDPYIYGESLIIDSNYQILAIGDSNPLPENVNGQYIGLIKLSDDGCKILRKVYHSAKMKYSGKPWIRSKLFKNAYMTDLIQATIDSGYAVYGVPINNGWLEFDTESDYYNYIKWDNDGTLIRFYKRERFI